VGLDLVHRRSDGAHGVYEVVTDTAKEIFWGVVLAVLFTLPAVCKGDYVIAFHASWCQPCKEMVPVEKSLCEAGYKIRTADIEESPSLAKYYKVDRIPCYCYVLEYGDGDYDSGCRIVGKCTQRQLEALCRMPFMATVGDVTRRTLGNAALLLGGGL
jgi:thiol-disulfide isomerase/thioredoxin